MKCHSLFPGKNITNIFYWIFPKYTNLLIDKYSLSIMIASSFNILCTLLGKKLSRQYIEPFFLFFLENTFWHFLQIVSYGDNCMKCQIPFFLGKIRKFTINLLSAELAQSVATVNIPSWSRLPEYIPPIPILRLNTQEKKIQFNKICNLLKS